MKKLLVIIIASICLLGAFPNIAFASGAYLNDGTNPCEGTEFDDPMLCGKQNANEENELQGTVASVLLTIFGVIGVIAVIFVVIGGFKYTTSQGDPGRVQQAKNTIMFSLIGLVITVSAFAITGFALGAFSGGGTAGTGGTGNGVMSLEITWPKTIGVNENAQIKVTIIPDYAEDKTLTFSSSDETVATISAKGKILGRKAGTTTITAKASNGVSTSITLTVTKDTKTETLRLEPEEATIAVGGTVKLTATVTPENANLTWTSNDTSVATVDSTGLVKGIKAGTAVITVKMNSGKKKTAKITVGSSGAQPVETYSAVFEKRNYAHSNGRSYDYWINVPEGATSNMPILIFLHGDGEMNRPNSVKTLGQVEHIRNGKGYIGIAPVGKNSKQDWATTESKAAIKGLIQKVASDYKSNKSRIYIWGFSRGAIGTWQLVNDNPGYFRAAVPVSCCPKISIVQTNFKNTKIYALAGSQESDYIPCMRSTVNQITSAGGSAKFETVSGANHGSITRKFPYTQVIDNWLLKQ